MPKLMFKETEEIIDEFHERAALALIERFNATGKTRTEIASELQIKREAIYGYISDNHRSIKLNRTIKMFMRYGYDVKIIVTRSEKYIEEAATFGLQRTKCFAINKESHLDLLPVRQNLLLFVAKIMDQNFVGKTLTEIQKLTGIDGTRILFLRNKNFDAAKITVDYYLRMLMTLGFDVEVIFNSSDKNDRLCISSLGIAKKALTLKQDATATANDVYMLKKQIIEKVFKTIAERYSNNFNIAIKEISYLLKLPTQTFNKLITGEVEKFTIEDLIQYAKTLNIPLNITVR